MSKVAIFVVVMVLVMVQSSYAKHRRPKGRDTAANPRDCYCPRRFLPVCASNEVTYQNMCVFNCAKNRWPESRLLVAYDGRCLIGGDTQF